MGGCRAAFLAWGIYISVGCTGTPYIPYVQLGPGREYVSSMVGTRDVCQEVPRPWPWGSVVPYLLYGVRASINVADGAVTEQIRIDRIASEKIVDSILGF